MNRFRAGRRALTLLAAALLATACVAPPAAPPEAPPVAAKVDEAAMLPLLGYLQLLQRMSPPELLRERGVLAAIPQTPATHLRLAMLLAQPRGPLDLGRALSLLDGVLKAREAAAVSLHPLAQTLASQFQERLRLDAQNDRLAQQLKESQRRNVELQEKLDALTDIERSLSTLPTNSRNLPGATR
ncbi:permease [Accumulibacter sp.]|uniref:permease n=1 Tax=Accumulibacter sp. TaxID=2053492 RepID=UPI0026207361|nr:permease [Accumulibacter sp.]